MKITLADLRKELEFLIGNANEDHTHGMLGLVSGGGELNDPQDIINAYQARIHAAMCAALGVLKNQGVKSFDVDVANTPREWPKGPGKIWERIEREYGEHDAEKYDWLWETGRHPLQREEAK